MTIFHKVFQNIKLHMACYFFYAMLSLLLASIFLAKDLSKLDEVNQSDFAKLFSEIKSHAEKGEVMAQLVLGTMYYEGRGVEKIFRKHFLGWRNLQSRGIVLHNIIWVIFMSKALA